MLNWLGSLKCPDCGGVITEEQKYCPHCGTDLDAPPQRSTEDAHEYFARAKKIYDRDGSMEDALLECEVALQYNPGFAEAHNLHGLILDALGKPAKAIKAYRKALELNPHLEDARANIRDFEAEQNEQRPHYGELEVDPDSPETDIHPMGVESETTQSTGTYHPSYPDDNLPRAGFKPGIWVILLIVVFALGFMLINVYQYLQPKSTVVFEVIPVLQTSARSRELETIASILTVRCQELGYKDIHFHVSSRNEIIAEIPNSLNPQKLAEEISTIGLLEFVDFGSEPVDAGVQVRTALNDKYFLPNISGPIFHTVLSNDAIRGAVVSEAQPAGYAISFTLTDEAAYIFAEYTATHRGEYLGIVLDGVVVSSPVINEPITGGEGLISGSFTEEEAKQLAAILRTRPLPIPIKLKQIVEN